MAPLMVRQAPESSTRRCVFDQSVGEHSNRVMLQAHTLPITGALCCHDTSKMLIATNLSCLFGLTTDVPSVDSGRLDPS